MNKNHPVKDDYNEPSPLESYLPQNQLTQNFNNLNIHSMSQLSSMEDNYDARHLKSRSFSNIVEREKNKREVSKSKYENTKNSKSTNKFNQLNHSTHYNKLFSDNESKLNSKREERQVVVIENPLIVEVVYADVAVSHRFVRFKIEEKYLSQLYSLIETYFKKEEKILNVNITSDSEITSLNKEGKNTERVLKQEKCSFSLCFIYDLTKDEVIEKKYNYIKQELDQKILSIRKGGSTQKVIKGNSEVQEYEKVLIKSSDLKNSDREYALSSWTFEFKSKFGFIFTAEPKFLEIRPKILKSK